MENILGTNELVFHFTFEFILWLNLFFAWKFLSINEKPTVSFRFWLYLFPSFATSYLKTSSIVRKALWLIVKVFLPNLLWSHSLEKIITFMELYENHLNEILLEKKILNNNLVFQITDSKKLNHKKKIAINYILNRSN